MIHLLAYGRLLRSGVPINARAPGQLRTFGGREQVAKFGPMHPGWVQGQLRTYTRAEMRQLTLRMAPRYLLRQISAWRGHPVYAFEYTYPDFEQAAPVAEEPDATPELVLKSRKLFGGRSMSGGEDEPTSSMGRGHKPPGKVKVVVTEARLNAMEKAMSGPVKVDITRGIKSIREGLSADDMRKAFMAGKYDHLMAQVGPAVTEPVEGAITDAVQGVHDVMLRQMPANVQASLNYDTSNPRIRDYIGQRTGNLITTSEDGMMEAVRAMTHGALSKGMNVEQSAALIRDSIGLNAPQARALANFKAGQMAAGHAQDVVDQRVAAYSERLLDQRANMIARTEVRNAQNAGQLDVWRQGVEDELLPAESKKVWQVDGNPCEEWCEQMDGEAVPLNDRWEVKSTKGNGTRYVDVPSEIHPHCMCIMQVQMSGT